ncbi:MAG: TIGR02281 family clan AA aspartic protease, partial [Bacteroidales bacterium]|nr:TIGR02281 family clan AA aspartic protease [Bacteroidales bacterium]
YDLRKAEEAYSNDDYDEAMSLVEKQLKATPRHIDALYLKALILGNDGQSDKALSVLDCALKYYGGEPEVKRSSILSLKGLILQKEERFAEAAKTFGTASKYARKDAPEYRQSILFEQAQCYYQAEDRAAAERVYRQMLKEYPDDAAAMVGLARNLRDVRKFDEALEWLDKAQELDDDYGSVYKFKMQVLDSLGRTDECIDAALKYYGYEDDASVQSVARLCGKHFSYAEARIRAQARQSDDPQSWLFLLTEVYENAGDWLSAIQVYDQMEKDDGDDERIPYFRARAYEEMGDYPAAVKDMTRVFEETDDDLVLSRLGDICRSGGFYDEAVRHYKACLERDPSSGYHYYAIGWSCELAGDLEEAMRYYDKGIDIDNNYAYLYQQRGDLRKLKGRLDEAREDYERVLSLDTIPEDGSCRHYALLGLGREDEALEWMNRVIASDTTASGSYYDKACLCGRMGRLDEALAALDTAFQKGFRRFAHLEHDDDMDPLRDLPAYKALVEKYRKMAVQHADKAAPDTAEVLTPDSDTDTRQPDTLQAGALLSEIPMHRRRGGTYEVPCAVNGLPLKFIFDTGASDITLSSVEADFMLKNDYLSEKDFRGSRKYLTASGSICDGAVVCLKEVKVGDVTLRNIEASVVKNQQAPLLLGQSALERLGSITIDNEASRLIIRKKE